jgi:hypothetical protein
MSVSGTLWGEFVPFEKSSGNGTEVIESLFRFLTGIIVV